MTLSLRLSLSAATVCALALAASAAASPANDARADRSAVTNVFRIERHAARDSTRYARPAARSPFETEDTRPLQIDGDRLTPQPSNAQPADSAWADTRVAPGRGTAGRLLPEAERRSADWDAYLRANGSLSADGLPSARAYAPMRPFDAARGAPGAPNPFDPSVPHPETRMFYDDGAGSRCTATGGAGTSRSSCRLDW
ncbi:hypothetical protein [Burkholderia multivorans]|uniref:hypothetical protein n=1 Tax=Burkholderia multivorans TaxID=87883 RepID=UPI00209D3213|nr:hypothetical protein [Burkholderia multivorans]MCO8591715.1 hypothetical protein [Burkholderia multivorans]MCO8633709.1 hypothetical protein [Burkholderia multivorans]MCO8649507.1 hypothetical protein [Burkholderia multivorans]